MQHVNATLEAMKSSAALPKDAPLGSTTTVSTITPSSKQTEMAEVTRVQALTESQLISIASKLLLQPFRATSTKEKIRGTKKISDEFGEHFIHDAIVGEQDVFSVTAIFHADIPERALEAAWRKGPEDGYLKSLARLSMHKILGSSVEDRTILLNDYVKALSAFPEFVIAQACEWFWSKDPNKFMPKIAEIASLAMALQNQMPKPKSMLALEKPRPPVRRALREEDSEPGKRRRAALVDFIKTNSPDQGAKALEFMRDDYPSNYSLEGTARRFGWQGWPKDFDHGG